MKSNHPWKKEAKGSTCKDSITEADHIFYGYHQEKSIENRRRRTASVRNGPWITGQEE